MIPMTPPNMALHHWLALVAFAAGFCSASCVRSHDIPVANLPPELLVPNGATGVVARGDGKTAAVKTGGAAQHAVQPTRS